MEYRAGQPQEEGGIDGCGLSSLARTFARCTRTSGYEFNHRAGPDTDARVSKPGSGAAHKGRPPVPSTDACAFHRARPSAAVKVAGRGRR